MSTKRRKSLNNYEKNRKSKTSFGKKIGWFFRKCYSWLFANNSSNSTKYATAGKKTTAFKKKAAPKRKTLAKKRASTQKIVSIKQKKTNANLRKKAA